MQEVAEKMHKKSYYQWDNWYHCGGMLENVGDSMYQQTCSNK
jgi:hypothetical protein